MGLSKTEVNLRRLLAAAPQQHNQAKLIHYITTLRELLEQLGAETTADGISSISKAKLNEYSEKIEALAAKLASPLLEPVEVVAEPSIEESHSRTEEASGYTKPSGLRRRLVGRAETEDATREHEERDSAMPVKLDATAQAHIEKHRVRSIKPLELDIISYGKSNHLHFAPGLRQIAYDYCKLLPCPLFPWSGI